MESSEELEVSWAVRPQLVSLAILGAFLVGYVVLLVVAWPSRAVAIAGVVVLAAVIVYGGLDARRKARAGWFLRLDHEGVTLRRGATVPWSDLDHVRVGGWRPRWWLTVLWPWTSTVGFVPRRGVQVPTLRAVGQPPTGFVSWGNEVAYSSPLGFSPALTTVTGQQVVDAVTALSTVPVRDLRHPGAP